MTSQDWARLEEALQDKRAEEADEGAEWHEELETLRDEINAAFEELEAEMPSR